MCREPEAPKGLGVEGWEEKAVRRDERNMVCLVSV